MAVDLTASMAQGAAMVNKGFQTKEDYMKSEAAAMQIRATIGKQQQELEKAKDDRLINIGKWQSDFYSKLKEVSNPIMKKAMIKGFIEQNDKLGTGMSQEYRSFLSSASNSNDPDTLEQLSAYAKLKGIPDGPVRDSLLRSLATEGTDPEGMKRVRDAIDSVAKSEEAKLQRGLYSERTRAMETGATKKDAQTEYTNINTLKQQAIKDMDFEEKQIGTINKIKGLLSNKSLKDNVSRRETIIRLMKQLDEAKPSITTSSEFNQAAKAGGLIDRAMAQISAWEGKGSKIPEQVIIDIGKLLPTFETAIKEQVNSKAGPHLESLKRIGEMSGKTFSPKDIFTKNVAGWVTNYDKSGKEIKTEGTKPIDVNDASQTEITRQAYEEFKRAHNRPPKGNFKIIEPSAVKNTGKK